MNFLKDLRDLFAPKRCIHCFTIINDNYDFLCVPCNSKLEKTDFFNHQNNYLEKLFWGKVAIKEAASLYYYHKKTPIQTLLKELKYNNLQSFGLACAKSVVHEIQSSIKFKNIDCVVVVPLHPKKEKQRGYNQVEILGKTIAKELKIPFEKNILLKTTHNISQTKQNKEQRHKSVQNNFVINPNCNLKAKNILIVDDVLTTGATLISCCKTIHQNYNVNISIITIACVI